MTEPLTANFPLTVRGAGGLWFEILRHGGIRRAGREDDILGLFVGSEVEVPVANLWVRRRQSPEDAPRLQPLLGPTSGVQRVRATLDGQGIDIEGHADDLRWHVGLRLVSQPDQWVWQVALRNEGARPLSIDLFMVQDVALASYASVRLNEHYVSQYVDLQPLHQGPGATALAVRQNQPVAGRHPWALFGSLRGAVAWATDAFQVQGLQARLGEPAAGLLAGLPGRRLQHEHSCVALQDPTTTLEPGALWEAGFFGCLLADHAEASGPDDEHLLAQMLARARAVPAQWPAPAVLGDPSAACALSASWFTSSRWFPSQVPAEQDLADGFGADRVHEERDEQGRLLSYFVGADAQARHVVLRDKEVAVLRPHGHILRGGALLMPDERALTSTVWMGGVFHSMLTQGHVSINRLLSTAHGYLGQFRSHGLRAFVHAGGVWHQLGTPSVFEITPQRCRWLYRHDDALVEVISAAEAEAMTFRLRVLQGPPLAVRVTLHVALDGDDGAHPGRACWALEDAALVLRPPRGSALATRFPQGSFRVETQRGAAWARVCGDEGLFEDGQSRAEPFVGIEYGPTQDLGLRITGHLVPSSDVATAVAAEASGLTWRPLLPSGPAGPLARLASWLPWLRHNALVHFLSPRGLEQYSGGGWGTRDVCQGPLEMLLASGQFEPVRDLLLRTFAAQNPDGDWPQWFMFFERERHIRADDAHGDIVFWPLLGLARYLLASGDRAILNVRVPFFGAGGDGDDVPTVQDHVKQALALIQDRQVPGTRLISYGHGDWNDSMQPADPAMRERLCSAWTVTLHHQTLTQLAQALALDPAHTRWAASLREAVAGVLADFQRLLVADGVVAGYVRFDATPGEPTDWLVHPRDRTTGLQFSLLPMMHAVLEDMLSPAQARDHLERIRTHLLAPDGARLFDAPLGYRGGPQRLFQRAESSAFFGREIGVMYVHAHLRYAQALAHVGDGAGFIDAMARVNPIGIQDAVPNAARRQANTYFSSSDAAFDDRYAASRDYARVDRGEVPVEAGWRIYSSGPGIAMHLLVRHVAGWLVQESSWLVDPVLPPALGRLEVDWVLEDQPVRIEHRLGPAGHGPIRILVNDKPLSFTREPHVHRPGAARVDRAHLRALLQGRGNRIVVQTG